MPLSTNLRGSLFMVIATASFTINDAITKLVIETMGLGQTIFIRGMFASLIIVALAWSRGALARPRHLMHPMVAMRTLCEVGAAVTFIAALAHMPLANISAVLQALPLAVTMGAALFLGETVGWRRWGAIGVGFAGVMVIVRPGFEGFTVFSLLALVTVMFSTARDLVTRLIPDEVPSMLVSSVTAVAVAVVGGVIAAATAGWTPASGGELGLLAAAALGLVIGYQFIIMAVRQGDISIVAPFRYTALVWALALGYLVFGEVPDAAMIAGAGAIVLSGLYTLYRERKLGRGKPAAESTSPAMGPDGL
ncbi:MAG: EamA family transporter [Hyphomicrobiales bacterium]|nr:MAG: EamA family transporter [Hyphomicrobiales bacterium]